MLILVNPGFYKHAVESAEVPYIHTYIHTYTHTHTYIHTYIHTIVHSAHIHGAHLQPLPTHISAWRRYVRRRRLPDATQTTKRHIFHFFLFFFSFLFLDSTGLGCLVHGHHASTYIHTYIRIYIHTYIHTYIHLFEYNPYWGAAASIAYVSTLLTAQLKEKVKASHSRTRYTDSITAIMNKVTTLMLTKVG